MWDRTKLDCRPSLSVTTTQPDWAMDSTGTAFEPVAYSDTGWAIKRVVTGRQCLARELGSKLSHHLLAVSLLAPLSLPFGLVPLSFTKAVSMGHVKRKMASKSRTENLPPWL